MGELRVDTLSAENGTSPVDLTGQSAAKAWSHFNGTGTIATRDSFNVSSLTDRGTGKYSVNHTNNMSDANYSIVSSSSAWNSYIDTPTAGSHLVDNASSTYVFSDVSIITTAVMGDLA